MQKLFTKNKKKDKEKELKKWTIVWEI
jgi:hypothetical protein